MCAFLCNALTVLAKNSDLKTAQARRFRCRGAGVLLYPRRRSLNCSASLLVSHVMFESGCSRGAWNWQDVHEVVSPAFSPWKNVPNLVEEKSHLVVSFSEEPLPL